MSPMNPISEGIKAQRQYMIDLRRHFHAHPEPSFEEFETSKRVQEELEAMGISFEIMAGTGVVGTIEGTRPGKTVALRADMDALMVTQENDVPYKSTREGVMHACGHDGHTAMLLGAARVLKSLENTFEGTVKLIFQPAEELVAGARKMIEAGALEDVDGLLGIHLWMGLPTGQISAEAGPRMASGDYVECHIEGRGGHGSMPNQGVDAALIAAAFIMNINALMSREISPLEPTVLTFGEVDSGTRFNVLAARAKISGTARTFSPAIRAELPEIINRYGTFIAESYRGNFSLNFNHGTPPTINDSHISSLARQSVEEFLGPEGNVLFEKTTGSEDLAYYLERLPGAIAFVGCQNSAKGILHPHHHPRFDIDEEALAHGAELYARFALNFLK